MANPTSFRLPADLLSRTAEAAALEGVTVTSLVTSLLDEGLKTRRFPGIVFRDGPTGRRAAVSGGPDVWEIVRAIRLADGEGEGRVRQVAVDTGIAIGLLHLAVDYASAYPEEIDARIDSNERAAERVRRMVEERERLLSR